MTRILLLILLAASSTASAIVIRDDVDDSEYRILASEFPALVDMPGEGHGVLIASQWVITAAHVLAWHSETMSPALIQVDNQWLLAGVSAWKLFEGDVRTARPGRYGQTSCNVRLSHYIEWIESVLSE